MKINNKQPSIGDKRAIKYFAILPVRQDENTLTWLETVYILQEYSYYYTGEIKEGWLDVEFLTKQEYLEYKKEGY